MTWKVGDRGWRGYARHYGNPQEWWPEIRPFTIREAKSDGTFELHCEGVMPGTEGKRTPGSWIHFSAQPDILHMTPEAALRQAKRVAIDANAEAAAKGGACARRRQAI